MATSPKTPKTPKPSKSSEPSRSRAPGTSGSSRGAGSAVPADARRAPRRGKRNTSAGTAPPDVPPVLNTDPGPVHFLAGLRCPTCKALNASWLVADRSAVECKECGQGSLVIGPEEGA